MKDGSRSRATKTLTESLASASRRAKSLGNSESLLRTAIENIQSVIGVEKKEIDGITYQVPTSIPLKKGTTLAVRSIPDAVLKEKPGPFSTGLGRAILAAYRGDLGPDGNSSQRASRLSTGDAYGGDTRRGG